MRRAQGLKFKVHGEKSQHGLFNLRQGRLNRQQ